MIRTRAYILKPEAENTQIQCEQGTPRFQQKLSRRKQTVIAYEDYSQPSAPELKRIRITNLVRIFTFSGGVLQRQVNQNSLPPAEAPSHPA